MQTPIEPIEKSEKILLEIRSLLAEELSDIDQFIINELHSTVSLTESVTQHIFKSGGKRLRPLLVVLAANACNGKKLKQSTCYAFATVIEFVHTATLLHDDVVDNANLRRGKKTANAIWNNQTSVLVGDFLYSRAFQILARENKPQTLKVLAETTNAIAEGEVRQLMNQHNPDLTEAGYFRVIIEKTARLFSAAAEIGAILSNAPIEQQQAMAEYGLQIGILFQIIDDILDYQASTEKTGKIIGGDLAEGKVTLPIIYALQASEPEQAAYIRETFQKGDLGQLDRILAILDKTNALQKARETASIYAKKAAETLSTLSDSPYQHAMERLIDFALFRDY